MRKTSIFGHFGPKWPILDNFWPKWAKREFFQKSAWNIFLELTSPNYNAKFQKKVMNGFQDISERMDEAKFKVLTN